MSALNLSASFDEAHAILNARAEVPSALPKVMGAFARLLDSSAVTHDTRNGGPAAPLRDRGPEAGDINEKDHLEEPVVFDPAPRCYSCAIEFSVVKTHMPPVATQLGGDVDVSPEPRMGHQVSFVSKALDTQAADMYVPHGPSPLGAHKVQDLLPVDRVQQEHEHQSKGFPASRAQPDAQAETRKPPSEPLISDIDTSEQDVFALRVTATAIAELDGSRAETIVQRDAPAYAAAPSQGPNPAIHRDGRAERKTHLIGAKPERADAAGLPIDFRSELPRSPDKGPDINRHDGLVGGPTMHPMIANSDFPAQKTQPAETPAMSLSGIALQGAAIEDALPIADRPDAPKAAHFSNEDIPVSVSESENHQHPTTNASVSRAPIRTLDDQETPFEHPKFRDMTVIDVQEADNTGSAEHDFAKLKMEIPFSLSQPSVTTGHLSAKTVALSENRDLAHDVAIQIARGVSGSTEPTIDLALNPEELGHVRMTLKPLDSGISVTIFADRPDTADLMRRHIETLAQEFRSLGYNNPSFSFGQGAPQDQRVFRPADLTENRADDAASAEIMPAELLSTIRASGGLDLKL